MAFELKVGEFIPEYIGKMQFYLAVLDDKIRLKEENPSIGIILCKSKSKTIVEYTLKDASRPINGSSYYATKEVPEQVRRELPSEDQVKKLLARISHKALEKFGASVFRDSKELFWKWLQPFPARSP